MRTPGITRLEKSCMNAMIIGADRLGNIPELLSNWDINISHHITGRNAVHQRKPHGLPANTGLLIIFTDFLGHNVMRNFRDLAQEEGIPVITCRRSTSCLAQSLASYTNMPTEQRQSLHPSPIDINIQQ